jgi:putative transposase
VPLSSYTHFAADDLLTEVVMERMLAGVATRRHARIAEPVGAQVGEEAKSTSRSAISRRFIRQTETALAELMSRDLSELDIKVLMLDGEHLAERCVVVALAITADGTKVPSGCGTVPRRTRPWSARCWPTSSRAAWPSTMGCWWSSTAPRPCRRWCASC